MSPRQRALVCTPGSIERVVQAAVGALIGSFALSALHDPPMAIAAALGAALLLTGAARGWCPGSLLAGANIGRTAAQPRPERPGVDADGPG